MRRYLLNFVKNPKIIILLYFILFSPSFLTGTLSDRFLIKNVKSNRSVKVPFQVNPKRSLRFRSPHQFYHRIV